MNYKKYILSCALALHSTLGLQAAELPDLSKMNILFLCPEDWSAEAIGAYGRGLVTVLDPGNDGIARLDAMSE